MKTLHMFSNPVWKTRRIVKSLKADVVFGSPAKSCAGIGICKVNPQNTAMSERTVPCCQRVSGEVKLLGHDLIEFCFPRQKVCKKIIARQFSFSRFRVNDPLLLPDWLTDAFELAPVHLMKGAYPVFFEEDFIRIRIRLKPA